MTQAFCCQAQVPLPDDAHKRAAMFGQLSEAWSLWLTRCESIQRYFAAATPRPWEQGLVKPVAPAPAPSGKKHSKKQRKGGK